MAQLIALYEYRGKCPNTQFWVLYWVFTGVIHSNSLWYSEFTQCVSSRVLTVCLITSTHSVSHHKYSQCVSSRILTVCLITNTQYVSSWILSVSHHEYSQCVSSWILSVSHHKYSVRLIMNTHIVYHHKYSHYVSSQILTVCLSSQILTLSHHKYSMCLIMNAHSVSHHEYSHFISSLPSSHWAVPSHRRAEGIQRPSLHLYWPSGQMSVAENVLTASGKQHKMWDRGSKIRHR